MPDRAPAEPSAEAERRRKADSTRPPGPPRPLSAAQEFLLWRDALIASSENNEDALWLAVELARIGQPLVSASSRLTNEEATEWAGLLVRLAYAVKDPDIVREVVKLRQVYLDANQAMPAALHRFDPGFVQRPRGRPKKRIRAEADLEHARRIYAARRRDGCFPDLTCDPWHLLHHLSTEVERQTQNRYVASPDAARPGRHLAIVRGSPEAVVVWKQSTQDAQPAPPPHHRIHGLALPVLVA